MKKKISNGFKKVRKSITRYISTNRVAICFVLLTLFETILVRNFTIGNTWDMKPVLVDLAILVLIVSLGYLIKPMKQFKYYFIWNLIITIMCVINSVYYTFYISFASFGLLASISQVGTVTDSLVEKFKIVDFIYIIFPIIFYIINLKLKSTGYYSLMAKVEKGKKMCVTTLLVGVILLAFTIVNLTGTDYSRLSKQWNREYIVERFGIILYQGNDLIQSLTPKISSLFGYDEAALRFREFYTKEITDYNSTDHTNKYTGVLDGMNVIIVHMESIQSFLIDKSINGTELTPTLNKLTKSGLYFSNFYSQISVGTSSDTEFTLNTSLMPALSGTVFVSYYNRNYPSLEKMLKEKDYYTFSMHANLASMWNRDKMHPNLGYDKFYSSTSFNITEENKVGLGLNDKEFFTQAQSILENIESENTNYMGTILQLSNHSPFGGTSVNAQTYDTYGKLNLTNTYTKVNPETKTSEVVTDDYLTDTKLGNYMISAHYADMALGEFLDYVNSSEDYENTVFVFYGDHDAKLSSDEYQYYYNYDTTTGTMLTEDDPNYVDFDSYQQELNRKVPLVIWTKNKDVQKKLTGENNNIMGMYDVQPTLANMLNVRNEYALGHDIFDIGEDNVVIFPNGNFVTNKIYYSNSNSSYLALEKNIVLDDDYIEKYKKYTEDRLQISNDIIVHDLIEKEGDKLKESLEKEQQVIK